MSDRDELKTICKKLGIDTSNIKFKFNKNRLIILNFSEKGLIELPQGIFDQLTSLKKLSLANNKLTEIPIGIFDKLTSLNELILSNNELRELPISIFDNLLSLGRIYLNNNLLRELPQGIFDNFNLLDDLKLSGNQIKTLSQGIFDNLISLKELDLNTNQLKELPENIFDTLIKLEKLNLNFNQITELPKELFDHLTWLKHVYLKGNQLRHIPIEMINSLKLVDKIDLRNNKLKSSTGLVNKEYTGSDLSKIFSPQKTKEKEYYTWDDLDKSKEEKGVAHIQRILKIISQVRVDIPVTLLRISELVNLKKIHAENILKSILEKQQDLGEYLPLEQVFIKKSEVKEEIFTKSTFKDSLQTCKACGDSQSILIRTCINCGEALPYCNICKRGFAEKDQTTNCPECDNPFHRTHLIAQVQSSGSCPVCRKTLTLAQVS